MESSASHSISRVLVFVLSLHGMLFLGGLTQIRTHMTNEINGVLMITAIAALLTVEVTSGILFFTNIRSNYYKVLKFLGIFSASIDSFLLLMVVDMSSSMNVGSCVLYGIAIVLYGIIIAYINCGDDDFDKVLNKTSFLSILTYIGLVLVPLALVLVLFTPKDLDWIVYPVIYTIFGMEMLFFLIIYSSIIFIDGFMFINDEKPKAQNLEAPQDKNSDLTQHDKKQSTLS